MVAAWLTLLGLILGVAPENVEDPLLPLSQTQVVIFWVIVSSSNLDQLAWLINAHCSCKGGWHGEKLTFLALWWKWALTHKPWWENPREMQSWKNPSTHEVRHDDYFQRYLKLIEATGLTKNNTTQCRKCKTEQQRRYARNRMCEH